MRDKSPRRADTRWYTTADEESVGSAVSLTTRPGREAQPLYAGSQRMQMIFVLFLASSFQGDLEPNPIFS